MSLPLYGVVHSARLIHCMIILRHFTTHIRIHIQYIMYCWDTYELIIYDSISIYPLLSICLHTYYKMHTYRIHNVIYIYTCTYTVYSVCIYIYIIIMYIILCTYIYMHIWMYLSRLFKVMTRWHCQEKARGSGCSFDHTSYCDAKLPSEGRRSSSNPRKTSMLCVFLLNLYWLRQEEQSCFLAMLWLHCIE